MPFVNIYLYFIKYKVSTPISTRGIDVVRTMYRHTQREAESASRACAWLVLPNWERSESKPLNRTACHVPNGTE